MGSKTYDKEEPLHQLAVLLGLRSGVERELVVLVESLGEVDQHGRGLEDLEAVRTIKGGNLAMREFGQEFGLLVVLKVDVRSGGVKLQARKGSSSVNLSRKVEFGVSFGSSEPRELTRFP